MLQGDPRLRPHLREGPVAVVAVQAVGTGVGAHQEQVLPTVAVEVEHGRSSSHRLCCLRVGGGVHEIRHALRFGGGPFCSFDRRRRRRRGPNQVDTRRSGDVGKCQHVARRVFPAARRARSAVIVVRAGGGDERHRQCQSQNHPVQSHSAMTPPPFASPTQRPRCRESTKPYPCSHVGRQRWPGVLHSSLVTHRTPHECAEQPTADAAGSAEPWIPASAGMTCKESGA